MEEVRIDTKEMLNAYIDRINKMESICDEVLTVMYFKYQRVPKRNELINEMNMLKKQKELKECDRVFLEMLITANNWFVGVSLNEYLDLWAYDRHIPYERKTGKRYE